MKTWYVDVYRFNEGVTDIQAQSITMVGEPNEVFTDYKLSHVPTLYVVSVYLHTLPMIAFICRYPILASFPGAPSSARTTYAQRSYAYVVRTEEGEPGNKATLF